MVFFFFVRFMKEKNNKKSSKTTLLSSSSRVFTRFCCSFFPPPLLAAPPRIRCIDVPLSSTYSISIRPLSVTPLVDFNNRDLAIRLASTIVSLTFTTLSIVMDVIFTSTSHLSLSPLCQ